MTNQELEQQAADLQKIIIHLEKRLRTYERAEDWMFIRLQHFINWNEANDLRESLSLRGLFEKLLEHELSAQRLGAWDLLDAWQKKVISEDLEVTINIKKKEDDPA